jgi:molecular chaperone GrpE
VAEQQPETQSSVRPEQTEESAQDEQTVRDLSACEAELEATRDRLLRAQAEVENVRRRLQREIHDSRRYANQPLLTDLLPVLDNMERAIEAAQQSSDGAGLLEGFKMVHQLLLDILGKHDCRPVAALGAPFDPSHHQAIMQEPSPEPKGTVTRVVQPGYTLHDRVIRPAQVFVSTGPAAAESSDDQGE